MRYTTFIPLLTCMSGGGTSKQKYGNFCFSCMYERGLYQHVTFSRWAHSKSTSLLQKVKAKVYSIECILSPMHKRDTFSISFSGQKQKHHVFLFLTQGCFQDIRSLAVFHDCCIGMLQSSDLASHSFIMLIYSDSCKHEKHHMYSTFDMYIWGWYLKA